MKDRQRQKPFILPPSSFILFFDAGGPHVEAFGS